MTNSSSKVPRIAYVILTCEKYMDTRVQWQLKTVFSNTPRKDLYYLGHTMDEERRLFSWGADDSYNGLPYKYTDFFRYANLTDYDWIVLMDDDTYIFQNRLINTLASYDSNEPLAMGYILNHIAHTQWGLYFSGGAGTVLSKAAYTLLQTYVQATENIRELVPHWCADISIGCWLRRHPQIKQINNSQFHPDTVSSNHQDLQTAITFHHLKTWEEYELCASQ